jgi:PIN domain nuclease of toxin-antitoxin system
VADCRPQHLDTVTRDALEEPENEVLFSAASIREIAIKARLGRLDFTFRPREILEAALRTGFIELSVRRRAATVVADLTLHSRNKFDRLLVAQAISEPVRLFTADTLVPQHSEPVTLVS